MDELNHWRKVREIMAALAGDGELTNRFYALLQESPAHCTCFIGQTFTVTDPWCPEHKVVLDFTGFVSSDLAED
jgi:hypothetical protein